MKRDTRPAKMPSTSSLSFLHHRFSKNYRYVLIEFDFMYTVISGAEWEPLFITLLQTFYNYPTKKKETQQ